MKVAIVHDDLTQRGGAERIVLALHRMFPGAPVYTSVYDPDGSFDEFRSIDVRTTFLQNLPHKGNAARALLPLYPIAFETLHLHGYDVVISSSSRFAHGVDAGGALHVCYCHAPARFLYQTERYLADGGPLPSWARNLIRPLLPALRIWDRRAARRPDVYVANSHGIARRIRKIYGRDARVVYPPVDTLRCREEVAAPKPDEPYYLVLTRLLPYKRVDLAVRACTRRATKLVVVGDGPARRILESEAGPAVEFLGSVSEDRVVALLQGCRALIHGAEEDFGIGILEANAAGKPVVAFGFGGAAETVVDGKTGVLFFEHTDEAVIDALDRFESADWDSAALIEHAETFSEPRFVREITSLIEEASGNFGLHGRSDF